MKSHKWNAFIAVLLCITLVAPCLGGYAQAAAPEGTCSLQLTFAPENTPLSGVRFQIYRVADVDTTHLTCHPTEQYETYTFLTDSSIPWPDRASTLAVYVARDHLEADGQATTDASGQLCFENLEPGLYLITGGSADLGSRRYRPLPALLSLPYTENGIDWVRDLATEVKPTYSIIESDTTRLHVLKVWEDDGYEDQRPDSVTVELLRNGDVYDTAVLSAENNWRHTWSSLSADDDWSLTEADPGEDYSVTILPNGTSYVVTNSILEDIIEEDPPLIDQPDLPDDGETDIGEEDIPLADLPQTGLLWWPVPLLAMLGILLVFLGCVRHRKGAHHAE